MVLRETSRRGSAVVADIRGVASSELDRRIRVGADEWSQLQDDLLATGGMLPTPALVARLVHFVEATYRQAEDARVEALRRQRVFDGFGVRDRTDTGWELV